MNLKRNREVVLVNLLAESWALHSQELIPYEEVRAIETVCQSYGIDTIAAGEALLKNDNDKIAIYKTLFGGKE